MSLQETVQVQTMMRGKLRESDPVPVDIPITLPEDLLRYLFCDVGLRIPECEIQKYWKHTRDTNCPWSGMSEGDHIPCAIYGDSAKFSLAREKLLASSSAYLFGIHVQLVVGFGCCVQSKLFACLGAEPFSQSTGGLLKVCGNFMNMDFRLMAKLFVFA